MAEFESIVSIIVWNHAVHGVDPREVEDDLLAEVDRLSGCADERDEMADYVESELQTAEATFHCLPDDVQDELPSCQIDRLSALSLL